MKLRTVIRLALSVSIVMLCVGFGVYSFLQLTAAENQRDFNLYRLVPQDATAILETDRMVELLGDINALNCSKDNHFLSVSELFVYLKKHLHTLMEATPHGFSTQMNKMLVSFHEPDTPLNQVLYCTLGAGDYELVESFIQKYCASVFPSKYFHYKGEEIRIYPMEDGRFLAAYFTSNFLVVSFQKRLIEQVIDAYRGKKSLMQLSSFYTMCSGKERNVPATVYVRMKAVDMGKPTDGIRGQIRLGSWAEFDLSFNEEAIYCSGISYGVDSTKTFINALRFQKPIEGFPGALLPSKTFFYNRWAISDRESIFSFISAQEYAKATYSNYIKQRDDEWTTFLEVHGGESVLSCLFQSADTLHKLPHAVLSIPVEDDVAAERALQTLLRSTSAEEGREVMPLLSPQYARYPKARKFKQYVLPRNTLLAQLTGITESALYTYACFYQGNLLLAPNPVCLSAYLDAVESGDVLAGTASYEAGIGSLAPLYNFVMSVDMEQMRQQPETYVRLVPNFFFRQADFFRHFTLSIQFTCVEGVVYPYIVLIYKG